MEPGELRMDVYTNDNLVRELTTWVGSKISSSKGRGALSPRGTILDSAGACTNVGAFRACSRSLLGNVRGTPMA